MVITISHPHILCAWLPLGPENSEFWAVLVAAQGNQGGKVPSRP